MIDGWYPSKINHQILWLLHEDNGIFCAKSRWSKSGAISTPFPRGHTPLRARVLKAKQSHKALMSPCDSWKLRENLKDTIGNLCWSWSMILYPVIRRELRSYGYSYSLLNEELRSYQEFPNHILVLHVYAAVLPIVSPWCFHAGPLEIHHLHS